MATLTLTTTPAQDARIIEAFTNGLGRPATAADVKAFLINDLTQYVLSYEQNVAINTVIGTVTPIKPS